jgi:hypothetical protein
LTKPAQTTSIRHRLPVTHRRFSVCARLTALAAVCMFALGVAPISSASAAFVWGDAHQLDLGQTITDMSCPTATQCTVVGDSNDETTFDPQTAGTVNAFPIASNGKYRGISCPSVTQCTAVGGGAEVTFNPTNAPSAPMHATVDTGAGVNLVSVSCPTADQCVAVDGSSGDAVSFNPTTGTARAPAHVDVGHGHLTSVTCLPTIGCVAVDTAGYEATFNPTTGEASTPQSVGLGGAFIPSLSDVTCQVLPSAAVQCSASASNGSVTTFDPSAASPPVPQFLSAAGLSGMACPTASLCLTALAHTGLVSFSPQAGGHPPLTALGVLGQGPIVCVSANQCTTSNGVGATTFDPTNPASITNVSFAPAVTGISCASAAGCRFGDLGGNLMLAVPSSLGPSPTAVTGSSILAISCPTSLRCTAAQANGQVRTFAFADGTTTGTSTFVTGSAEVTAIDCPTITVCALGESNGSTRTFNSQTLSMSTVSSVLDLNQAIRSVSCADGTHCVAVDAGGAETSYNPQSLNSPHAPLTVDPGNALVAVSCPSDTQCTAVDGIGQQVTFNPLTPPGASPVSIDPGNALAAISCPKTTECVAVDNAGESLAGNPQDTATPWDIEQIPGTSALTGISCVSDDECSAIDSGGEYSVGVAVPVSSTVPTVSGAAVVGQSLTETHAAWTGTPTAYAYRWEDCDANGLHCAPIANATSPSYTVAAGDAGETIRVIETASNAGGSSAPATSDATAVVPVPSTPPTTPPTTTPAPPVAKQRPPDAALVTAGLRKVLAPTGARASIKALLKAGGYTFVFDAPSAGRLALDWYQLPKGARLSKADAARTKPKPVLVASVSVKIHKAGKIKVKIKLSRAGRTKLRLTGKRLKLTAQSSFTPSGAKQTTARRTFTVRR